MCAKTEKNYSGAHLCTEVHWMHLRVPKSVTSCAHVLLGKDVSIPLRMGWAIT
uniref:Uncharacterized protein n=1 Tax=Anguilla anguilla TaxID=7936 RepID=A0A0E9VWT0_ANGAN